MAWNEKDTPATLKETYLSQRDVGVHALDTRKQAGEGLMRHNNEYTIGTLHPDEGPIYDTPDEAVDGVAFSELSAAVIGTPDDLVARIRDMMELTGGFCCVIGFVHDWANRENTRRSWDMVARYVIPRVNGLLDGYYESHRFVTDNRDIWNRATQAIRTKILENERTAEALALDEAKKKTAKEGVS